MRIIYVPLLFISLLGLSSAVQAKSRTDLLLNSVVKKAQVNEPIVAVTPPPTPAVADPTPLPTIEPTPLPTLEPTPAPTPSPVPTPIDTPSPVSTPQPVLPLPVSSGPVPQAIKSLVIPVLRSDVAVITPVTGQQVQQAALALSATPLPTSQARMLLSVAPHTASTTLTDPASDYAYMTFTGLNRNLTLGLDSLAVLFAAAGIYVAVRSGSTMHV